MNQNKKSLSNQLCAFFKNDAILFQFSQFSSVGSLKKNVHCVNNFLAFKLDESSEYKKEIIEISQKYLYEKNKNKKIVFRGNLTDRIN